MEDKGFINALVTKKDLSKITEIKIICTIIILMQWPLY